MSRMHGLLNKSEPVVNRAVDVPKLDVFGFLYEMSRTRVMSDTSAIPYKADAQLRL